MKRLFRLRDGLYLLLFCLPVLLPGMIAEATYANMVFLARRVVPALFFSLCLSALLVSSAPARALYRFPFGVELTVLFLGILCGFPVGARCAATLYKDGLIDRKRAEYLCSFSNLASLPFLRGVIGAAFPASTAFGSKLACLQAAGAVLTMGSMYLVMRPACHGITAPNAPFPKLAPTIAASAHTLLEIGGMLVFFGVAADAAVSVLHLQGIPEFLLRCGLEFSSGCTKAALLGGTAAEWPVLLAVGSSGLCVASQVASVIDGQFSMRSYVIGKAVQCAWMALLFRMT